MSVNLITNSLDCNTVNVVIYHLSMYLTTQYEINEHSVDTGSIEGYTQVLDVWNQEHFRLRPDLLGLSVSLFNEQFIDGSYTR